MRKTVDASEWQEEIGFIPHLPGMPEAINADSFEDDVLRSPVPVLVEFWAARCGSCRRLAPELAAVAQDLKGKVRVFTINVDEEPEAAVRFGVYSIPATLLFVEGKEQNRTMGAVDSATLVHFIKPFLQREHQEEINA